MFINITLIEYFQLKQEKQLDRFCTAFNITLMVTDLFIMLFDEIFLKVFLVYLTFLTLENFLGYLILKGLKILKIVCGFFSKSV